MKPLVIAACVAWLMTPQPASGQSITTEAAVATGFATDEVAAVAAQVRVFGALKYDIRFFGEAAWAASSDEENDAFGVAYPYDNRVQIVEAYAERMFRPREALIGLRGGRFRTPFGIYSASDQSYSGFLRPPLVRYDEYSAVSNYMLEHGADLIVGIPRLTLETAIGAPADIGPAVRRSGVDSVVRVQGYHGPFIVGASYIRTTPLEEADVPDGRADFTGIDLRWTHRGVQARGEWMTGHPFEGASTTGWYADLLMHLVRMGPVTAVARIEQLASLEPGEDEERTSRQTVGALIRLFDRLALNVNLVHRRDHLEELRPVSFDVGLTWSIRHSR